MATKLKKANFIFRTDTILKLNVLIPNGERSKFVNGAVDEALSLYSRRKAAELMDKAREESHWHMTDEQIRNARSYGRA